MVNGIYIGMKKNCFSPKLKINFSMKTFFGENFLIFFGLKMLFGENL
jgi:hypothetical protein